MRSFIALALVALLTACGDVAGPPDLAPLEPSTTFRAPDGTVRVPYLGGAFVTKNREMPVDVEQAIAGEPTDHPVVVWAGD